jgi:hypothetical protein
MKATLCALAVIACISTGCRNDNSDVQARAELLVRISKLEEQTKILFDIVDHQRKTIEEHQTMQSEQALFTSRSLATHMQQTSDRFALLTNLYQPKLRPAAPVVRR